MLNLIVILITILVIKMVVKEAVGTIGMVLGYSKKIRRNLKNRA